MASAVKRGSYDPYRNVSYMYDGSAVRVVEGGEVLQPRPRIHVRPRYEEQARPRVVVRPAGKVSLFAVAGFSALTVMAVLIIMSYVQLSAISRDVVGLNSEMTKLQGEEAILRARYELAYDVSAIESAVTADGSMSRPQAGQMVYVDLTEPDSVVVYEKGEETTGGFLDGARQIVEHILAYF